jgi:hypothetical protein
VKDSYQRKHCCGDERESTLGHFSPSMLVALALLLQLPYDSALLSERRRDVGGYLLSCLFPDQPVHCFHPGLEPVEFPPGEGLQPFVEDFG